MLGKPLSVEFSWARVVWFAGLLLMAQGLLAAELYRWVDGEGRQHFGDRPPPGDVEQVERIRMPAFAPPGRPVDEDPYSILNQLERLEDSREARERERRERAWRDREYALRQRELDLREQEAEGAGSDPVRGYVGPVYPRPPIHRPGGPGHRPGRPPQRPPYNLPGSGAPDHPAFRPRPPYVAPRPPMHHPRPPVPEPRPAGPGAAINLHR